MKKRTLLSSLLLAGSILAAQSSHAITVWTDWQTVQYGPSGGAEGQLGDTSISYSGQVLGNAVVNGSTPVWNPMSTYVGGLIDTSPNTVGDIITMNSNSAASIEFSEAVIDPVIAFWSLGQPSFAADFVFDAAPIFQVGGPNSIYGGSAVQVSGNTVSGFEGNGIVMFQGAFDSISWSSTAENFYGITVGINGQGSTTVNPVPVPASFWLFGFALAGFSMWQKKARKTA